MNEFLNQFLIECREIVEQASEGLLTLEHSPHDPDLLDGVFRAFHTLKGSAGIVEFPLMERVVHGAEDILSAARAGRQSLGPDLVGECLACLDQVGGWLDIIERTGELPHLKAEPAHQARISPETSAASPAPAWLSRLLERNGAVSARAVSAVRFVPDVECFFDGEDPLARVMALPKLLALAAEPASDWPALREFDPYRCNLILTAVTGSPLEAVTLHMKGSPGEIQIVPVFGHQGAGPVRELGTRARQVLEAQIALLDATPSHSLAGCIGSAGRVAANVLRFCGYADLSGQLDQATQQSIGANLTRPLRNAIAQILAGTDAVATSAPASPPKAQITSKTLRVEATRIDALVRLASELTVAKNALGYLVKQARADGNAMAATLKSHHGTLEHLVGEVQTAVLALRVVPLRSVFQRFPRILRELAASLNKPIRFHMSGEETEADKTIVEMLFEPLLHVLRNCIDHGVESSDERARRGKPTEATIRLHASRQGHQVLIEASDDGGGIDVARVRDVARQRGIVPEERLQSMTDAEVVDLIFAPGFSTAVAVTALSGRGVGMDAIRTAVRRVGGQVSVETRWGAGTTVKVLLPFSVMMTHIMTVESGSQVYGIPLDAIAETIRVPVASISGIGAARALVVRDRTVPVIDLADTLGGIHPASEGGDATIVIAVAGGILSGIQVDRVGEQMEVILQPLEGLLAGTPGITGTTLLGNGQVLLVLDIGAILQ